MSTLLEQVYTVAEAAKLWDMSKSNLRMAITNNRFTERQVRKSEGTWLITREAMVSLFGDYSDINTTNVFTIGYEGISIENFINTLLVNNIHTIFDVREIPLSRKKGFSKNSLWEHLSAKNIGYNNFKELGSPKHLREALYRDKDYAAFFSGYRKYLKKQPEALEILVAAITSNPDKNFCLLCFEKDPLTCHRSIIAEELVNSQPSITKAVHL